MAEFDFTGTARSLLNIEANTIVREEITGEAMPPVPHAILDIAGEYTRTLCGFGADVQRYFTASIADLPTLEPWVLKTRPPAERIVFERNPYYYRVDGAGHQLPYIDRVVFSIASNKIIPAKAGAGESDLQARYLTFDNYTFLKAGEQTNGYKVLASEKLDENTWRIAASARRGPQPRLFEFQLRRSDFLDPLIEARRLESQRLLHGNNWDRLRPHRRRRLYHRHQLRRDRLAALRLDLEVLREQLKPILLDFQLMLAGND